MTAVEDTDDVLAQRIDAMPLRGLFLTVPILCTLIMVFEGMDNNIISYVGPMIREELGLSATLLGVIYTASVASALIGAAGVAPLSDRFGRRPLLLLTNLVMFACTLVTPFLHTAWMIVATRFVVGIAFGAAVPSTFALAADYAPKRYRAMLVMIVTAGVALGFVCSGFLSAWAIPAFGWRPLMLGLAVFSACWTVFLFFVLPEAPQHLLRRPAGDARAARLLALLGLTAEEARAGAAAGKGARGSRVSVHLLLEPQFRRTTFMTLFVVCSVYAVELLISHWLPAMLMAQGLSVSAAASITAVGKIASIAGSIGVGWIMDRHGLIRVLSGSFFCAAAAFALLSLAFAMPLLLVPAVVCMCFFVDGSFSGSQALTVTSYPAHMRATASGWITGLSRLLGGGSGTIAGGVLMNAGFDSTEIALVMLAVMAAGGSMLIAIGRHRRRGTAADMDYTKQLRSTT